MLIQCFYEVQMQHLSHQLPFTITDRKDRIVSLRIEIIYWSGLGSSALLKWWKRCLRHRFPVLESDHLSPTPWWISQHTLLFSAKSWEHNAVAPRNAAQFVKLCSPSPLLIPWWFTARTPSKWRRAHHREHPSGTGFNGSIWIEDQSVSMSLPQGRQHNGMDSVKRTIIPRPVNK